MRIKSLLNGLHPGRATLPSIYCIHIFETVHLAIQDRFKLSQYVKTVHFSYVGKILCSSYK